MGRVVAQLGPKRVEVLVAPRGGADAVHAHAVAARGALVQLVVPGDGVEGARRQDLDLVAPVRHQALGQHAGPCLGAAADVGAVAGTTKAIFMGGPGRTPQRTYRPRAGRAARRN